MFSQKYSILRTERDKHEMSEMTKCLDDSNNKRQVARQRKTDKHDEDMNKQHWSSIRMNYNKKASTYQNSKATFKDLLKEESIYVKDYMVTTNRVNDTRSKAKINSFLCIRLFIRANF
ncbi:hypothetical protein OTU49_006953 [Cherax quadricarinatus]|uniref:Uncharacterized protein n=1 Tax=Cherax quadricarinatus TaxID=27406 RepID=A0AAW0WZV3_CHEQU